MTPRSFADSLATAVASLIDAESVTDIAAVLLADVVETLEVDAAGLMLNGADGVLQLLASSSHRAHELELFQLQADSGPCVDAVREARTVTWAGAEAIVARWPVTGPAIVSAGFAFTHAVPLRWHGHIIGGLNIFHSEVREEPGWTDLARGFADIAALVIVNSAPIPAEIVLSRVQEAIRARSLVERAKGVIAHQQGIDMAAAYDVLSRRAYEQGISLTLAATEAIATTEPR